MAYRNVGFVNNFGLFMNRRNELLPLNDKMISHPSVLVENIAKHFTTEPDRSVIIDTLSQAEIFTKILDKPKPAAAVPAPKPAAAPKPKPAAAPKPKPRPPSAPKPAAAPKRAKKMGTTSGYKALVATKNILPFTRTTS